MNNRYYRVRLILLATLVCWAGCGPQTSAPPIRFAARWSSTTARPLDTGGVGPVSSRPPPTVKLTTPAAKSQPDGTFEMSTFEDGDGVVAGPHRVLVRGPSRPGRLYQTRHQPAPRHRREIRALRDFGDWSSASRRAITSNPIKVRRAAKKSSTVKTSRHRRKLKVPGMNGHCRVLNDGAGGAESALTRAGGLRYFCRQAGIALGL